MKHKINMASEAGFIKNPIFIDHHQEQQRQYPKQQALKCPRCNSSNTKFCHYNNYSLSQPRHFCKACKRYWTRGGTLRNVPVGGGCRKNKRVKLSQTPTVTTTPTITNHVASTSQPVDHNSNPNPNPNIDQLSLFYGLVPQNPNYQRFNTIVSGYGFSQPRMSNLGSGFSSSDPTAGIMAAPPQNSSSLLSSCPSSIVVGSTPTSASAPTMTSILATGFQQQQRLVDWRNQFQGQNDNDKLEAMPSRSGPNSLLWNMMNGSGGGWFDPTSNIDSSVPSLI